MPAKLTKEKLIENISAVHCGIKLGHSENPERDLERIHRWVKLFIKNNCKFKLKAAANEQLVYTEAETKLPIGVMETMKVSGRKQVLDYHPFIFYDDWIPLSFGIERKSKQDWHGTVYVGKNYKRFKREIQTWKADPVLKNMYVFVECPYEAWVTYYPPVARYSGDQVRKMIVSKDNALASIMSKGVNVCWFSSRQKAAGFIKTLCFQYAVETYAEWMDL